MAELATIARPYAEALFRVAEGGDIAAWSTLVQELALLQEQVMRMNDARQLGRPTGDPAVAETSAP